MAAPVIEAADVTYTSQVDATSWPLSFPNASSGDLLIPVWNWDDSANVTSVVAPAGPNGETISSVRGPQASNNTEMRMQVWRTIATGSWTAGTRSFTPSAQEQAHGACIRVPAGEFDATNPIVTTAAAASPGTAETNVNSPAFTAATEDAGGRLVIAWGSDGGDDITPPASGHTTILDQTATTGFLITTRDAEVTAGESIPSYTSTIAGDSWAVIAFIVRGPADAGGAISGSASVAFTASGTLTGSGALAGSSSATFSPVGVLTGTGSLSGSSALSFSASGTLTESSPGALSGSVSLVFTASGTLTGTGSAPVTSGGWGFYLRYEQERERRRRRRQEMDEARDAIEQIDEPVTKEIAQILQKQEREAEHKAELKRLQALVALHKPEGLPERVEAAVAKSIAHQTMASLRQLDKELKRMFEDGEMAVLTLLVNL